MSSRVATVTDEFRRPAKSGAGNPNKGGPRRSAEVLNTLTLGDYYAQLPPTICLSHEINGPDGAAVGGACLWCTAGPV